jgi:hypothetical protein
MSVNVLLVVRDQSTAEGMKSWCMKFLAESGKLSLVQIADRKDQEVELWAGEDEQQWWGASVEGRSLEYGLIETSNYGKSIRRLVRERKPELLVLQDRIDHPDVYRNAIQRLVEEVSCAASVFLHSFPATSRTTRLAKASRSQKHSVLLRVATTLVC